MTGFSYLSFSKPRAKQKNPRKPGLCEKSATRQCQKSGNRFPLAAAFLPLRPVNTSPCRSGRRLRSFDLDLEKQNQKIAAFGSSYVKHAAKKRSP
ncbi:hypothetical protein [Pseudomonas koreensis]|uniref:hypothetical protein n=1 Tax=Pseudomonas koreensis TaxID=198620 RepID=UPI0013E0757E|nr:hypothetical protein [Pseudomonas koreensis]